LPLAHTSIKLSSTEDDYTQIIQTDADGKVVFDLPSVRHFKYGNSLETGGIAGTPTRTDYLNYVFDADGYESTSISAGLMKTIVSVVLR
jgi:hypothetical protein